MRNGFKLAAIVAGVAMLMLLLGAAPPNPYGTTEALNLIYTLFGSAKTVSDSIDTEVDRANTRLGNLRTYSDSISTRIDRSNTRLGNIRLYADSIDIETDRVLTRLGHIRTWVDSLTELESGPRPVSISEHTLFSGITMYSGSAGSATNLKSGHLTFPPVAGPNVDGAKALELVIDWTNFEHGGFRIEHVFSNSATDTAALYWNGTGWSTKADTVAVTDSTALTGGPQVTIAPDAVGSITIRIPHVPGAGYYYCRIYPWGTAHANWINGLHGVLRVVQ